MAGQWVDVGEAARALGISTDAVRKRITRGSLEASRENGSVLVWLDEGGTGAGPRARQEDSGMLLEAKDETIRVFEEQLRLRAEEIQRRDVIISQLTQANSTLAARVPELEAPREDQRQAPAEFSAESSAQAAGAPQGAQEEEDRPPGGEAQRQTSRAEREQVREQVREEVREEVRDLMPHPANTSGRRSWWRRLFGG